MSAELDALRAAVRSAAEGLGGPSLCRNLDPAGPGWDQRSWSVLAEQIGVSALGLPESAGGIGGLAELAVVAEELGAALLPVPFLSTVLAGQVLAAAGTDGQVAVDDVLTDITAGQPAAFAGLNRQGWWSPDDIALTAEPSGADWVLRGHMPAVLGAAGARWIVVAAATGDGTDLFVCPTAAPGVRIAPLHTLDLSRAQASVSFEAAPARRVTVGDGASDAVLPALDIGCIVLAAEQLGGTQAALDSTVAYVKDRRQFGRAIGSFQAVKHTLADLLVLAESSRSAVGRAVEADDRTEAAAVARSWCSDAYRTVSAEAIQLHGGVGFTWEHDCHLYYRRARADAQLLGGSALHRERIAATLGW